MINIILTSITNVSLVTSSTPASIRHIAGPSIPAARRTDS